MGPKYRPPYSPFRRMLSPQIVSRRNSTSYVTRRPSSTRKVKSGVRFRPKLVAITRTRKNKKKPLFESVPQEPSSIVTSSFTLIPQKGNGGMFAKYAKDRLIPTLNYRSQDYDVIEQNGGFQSVQGTSSKLNHAGFYEGTLLPLMIANSNSSVNGSTANLMVMEATQELNFTNQSNATCKFTIYDVMNRQNAHESTTLNDPISYWYDQSKKEDPISSASTIPISVGATPFDCRSWCQMFKVVKVTKGYLLPGQTHKHIQKAHVNNVFSRDQIVIPGCIGQKTSHCFVVCEGCPVTENTGAVVSTAPTTVIMLRKIHYDLKLIPSYKDVNYIYDNLTTLTTPYVIPYNNAPTAYTAI